MRPTKSTFSEEHCEAIRQGHLGKKHSPETKRKIAEAQRLRWEKRKKTTNVEAST